MITPIETRYAGCRFRSRLEARWACFFDALGIRWEYEAQGYKVGPEQRPYLPDFWLPDFGSGVWVEVKGSPGELDTALLEDAVGNEGIGRADVFGDTKILILGPVPEPGHGYTHVLVSAHTHPRCTAAHTSAATYTKVVVRALPDRPPILVQWGRPQPTATDIRDTGDLVTARPAPVVPDLLVQAAYRTARSARFEHGEAGAA
ncbi:hypothetical protein OG216_09855 [Streptomycetaceae bacterium NBC_01309]